MTEGDDPGHHPTESPADSQRSELETAHEQRLTDALSVGASDALFRLLVASVRDYAIFMLDPGGHVATWNAGAQQIKGYAADEIVGSHFSRFYPEEEVRAGKCDMELELAVREGRFEDEGWRIRKDGTRFWANVVITAVRDQAGDLVGFAKVTRDLTDRRRAEEERAARLAAEQANRAKDEFLAILGHELRNPLAPILTALQLLKLRGDPRSAREHQVMERQVRHLMRLVDDLLDVSRIARGKLEMRKQIIDLRDPIAKAVEIASPLLERKGHHFEIRVPQEPLPVEADDARLVQLFANLLNNAAKYTDRGGHVILEVRRTRDHVVVEVRDDGIGIPPELLPRMFQLFVQGQQSSERAQGGLGLGLTVVQQLARAHGGEVEAHSAGPGRGSTFVVRLPAVDRPMGTPPEGMSDVYAAAQGRRVLIVDDNEDARSLLADMLRAVGHDSRTCADGPSALEILDSFPADVAILDIGLPGMNGYELAERIRQRPDGGRIRLIAVTGFGELPEARARLFTHQLVKPVALRRLLDLLAEPLE